MATPTSYILPMRFRLIEKKLESCQVYHLPFPREAIRNLNSHIGQDNHFPPYTQLNLVFNLLAPRLCENYRYIRAFNSVVPLLALDITAGDTRPEWLPQPYQVYQVL